MKYALFDFIEEECCEIGESRWISGEDRESFDNDNWVSNKIVTVKWPNDFSSNKILKLSIDPERVPTKTFAARVVKFSDEYESIRKFTKSYVETGSTATPHRGRGKRVSRPNSRYEPNENSDTEDTKESPREKTSRKPKKAKITYPIDDEVRKVKEKYNIGESKRKLSCSEDDGNDADVFSNDGSMDNGSSNDLGEENAKLKEENCLLKKQLKERECEVKHLENVIRNMKDMPVLHDVAMQLKRQLNNINMASKHTKPEEKPSHLAQDSRLIKKKLATTLYSSEAESESTSVPISYNSTSSTSSTSSDAETSEYVTICRHVQITKKHWATLKSKGNLKDYVYALMAMLWSRDFMAKHSISGKVSNAFKAKQAKPQLDPEKVQSICEHAAKKFGCKDADVKKIMTAKTNNIAKVLLAQEKFSSTKSTD